MPRLLALLLACAFLASCSSDPKTDEGSAKKTESSSREGGEIVQDPGPDLPLEPVGGEEEPAWKMMLAGDFDAAMVEYERLMTEHRAEPLGDYYWQRYMEAADLADDDVTEEIVACGSRLIEKGSHPSLESRAREYRVMVMRGKGKLEEAEKDAVALGYVRDWFLCGPFDNESETGFKTAYGPEKEFSLSKDYDGKHGKNRFFRSARARYGALDMTDLFRMNSDVCAYAAALVRSGSTRPVAVRLGSSGATKVWINGVEVLASDAYRRAGFDQDVAGGVLEKGWNVLLVKVCQKGGGEDTRVVANWQLALRLTQPDGKPLADVETEGDLVKARDLKISEVSGVAAEPVDTGAEGMLLAAIKADEKDALARARWAFLKMKRHALDENDRGARDHLRAAVKLREGVPVFHLWLGEAEDTKNHRLDHIRQAQKLAPGSPLAIWSEGGQHEGHIDDKALACFEEALKQKKGLVIARMSMAELYARRGGAWLVEAEKIYREILKDFPDHGLVKAYLVRLGQAPPGERTKFLEERLASWQLEDNVRGQLVTHYRSTGQFDRAIALLDAKLELDPFDVASHLKAGDIHESRGEHDKALERYEAALAISPENNTVLVTAANCCVAAGRPEAAAEWLTRALALRPNQPEVSQRLRTLKPKEVEFWRGYEADLKPHIQAALKAKQAGDESVAYVFKHDVLRVNENGTSNYFTQQVIRIFDDRGAQEYRRTSALGANFDTYSGGRPEFKTSRRIRQDGSEVEAERRERSFAVGFPNLSAGDVIVVEFQLEEAGEPRYKGYFGLILPLQPEFYPVHTSRVTFVHPEKKDVYHEAVRFNAKPEVTSKDGNVVTTWEVQGIPQVVAEPNMPPFLENVPYIHFSTFKSWRDVGEWFSGLVRDQFEASPEIKDAVKKAVGDAKTRAEKIEKLYQLMVSRTRYEALNLDNHAYLPFKASETFARQYGDCKDTATLFVTMMREIGEEANLVLVRTNDMGVIDLHLPSMKVFNHCIAYVPDDGTGKGMFIDGTARYYAAKDLPSMDQGAVVFVVKTDDKAAAQVSDWLPPEFNTRDSVITVKLDKDGSATIITEATVTGMEAGQLRSRFQEGAKREKLFQDWYNRFFDSVEVQKLSFNDLSNYNLPVQFRSEVRVPRFARVEGNTLVFRSGLFPSHIGEEFGSLSDRKHDLILQYPQNRKEKLVFELPSGWKVKSLPSAVSADNELAGFSWKAKAEAGRIAVDSSMSIKTARVPKGDYRKFRDFAVTVDKAQEEEIVLERDK